jgi:hypothetical protein
MHMKKLLSMTALAGALATSSVAFADHDRWERGRVTTIDHRRARAEAPRRQAALDVIDTERLAEGRGVATFLFESGMRRDGLQLTTDAQRVKILSVQLEYSDGRVVEVDPRQGLTAGSLLTIQRGRPPGLRVVRVAYAMNRRDRGATLQLVQIHDGDGYTHEEDLWKYHDDDGYYPDDDR